MIAIIDYGVGNIFSLKSSFACIGADAVLTSDKKIIEKADKLILPGVGAFADAAQKLKDSGLFTLIQESCAKGKPLMGICLGMQLLFEKSYEYGETEGLGLIHGSICHIGESIQEDLKIPHIGWNSLNFSKEKNEIFKYLNDGDFVYFVHSYHGTDCQSSTIATTEYGGTLTAAVADKNIFGMQFHPEKSGDKGLSILKAFCEI